MLAHLFHSRPRFSACRWLLQYRWLHSFPHGSARTRNPTSLRLLSNASLSFSFRLAFVFLTTTPLMNGGHKSRFTLAGLTQRPKIQPHSATYVRFFRKYRQLVGPKASSTGNPLPTNDNLHISLGPAQSGGFEERVNTLNLPIIRRGQQ